MAMRTSPWSVVHQILPLLSALMETTTNFSMLFSVCVFPVEVS